MPFNLLIVFFVCWFSIKNRVFPWHYFQINASLFNEKKGIFSKYEINELIPEKWRLSQKWLTANNLPLTYPVFIKPDWGQSGIGVKCLENDSSLHEIFKKNKKLQYFLQEKSPFQKEIEIFLLQENNQDNASFLLLYVEVFSKKTIKNPIHSTKNSNTYYRDIEIENHQKNIMRDTLNSIIDFKIARFTLNSNSLEDILNEKFKIIEINLFIPMPLSLLDRSLKWSQKVKIIKKIGFLITKSIKNIPKNQVKKNVLTKQVIRHYKVKKHASH